MSKYIKCWYRFNIWFCKKRKINIIWGFKSILERTVTNTTL